MNKDNKNHIQVRATNDGETECFSFELPKGALSAKHIQSFLDFVSKNEAPHVMKSLLHIYFTALDDQFFDMTAEQRLCLEQTLTLLADLSCTKK